IPAGDGEEGVEFAPLEEDDLPAMVRLHQAEPVRFFRPLEDWHKLLAAGMRMNPQADLFAVRQRNGIVAYAGLQRPGPDPSRALPLPLLWYGYNYVGRLVAAISSRSRW